MMDGNSTDDYLSDPQFMQVISTTLSLEVANKEKEIKETSRQLGSLKSIISSYVKDRKRLKQLYQVEQKNKIIFQTTLDSLRKIENEKILEVNLIQEKQNDSLLRAQIDQEKFLQILEIYKETWIKYEAEYEAFPLAIERKKHRNEGEKVKIQCMIQGYKTAEHQKMLNLRDNIDNLKRQTVIIKLSELTLKRWSKQKEFDELIDEYHKLKIIWNNKCQQHQKIMMDLEAEARDKALARQQMPPPRIDFSFMRAVYAESSPKDQFWYLDRRHKEPDLDTISVNTLRLEEICRDQPSITLHTTQNTREEENDVVSTDAYEDDANLETYEERFNNEISDTNTEALEKVCRQLSITEEMSEVPNYETNEEIPSQSNVQIHLKSQPTEKTFSNDKSNHLKKRAPHIDDSFDLSLKPSDKKKSKIDHRFEVFSQVQQDIHKQKTSEVKQTSHNNTQFAVSQPQIRQIETISQPINTLSKPPMAEVPPTPSALYSPRLGSYYGSNTNLSNMMDPSLDDLDNINWKDYEPSRGTSDISFMSDMSIFNPRKPTVTNVQKPTVTNVQKPISKPQDVDANNFFNFLSTNKPTTTTRFF